MTGFIFGHYSYVLATRWAKYIDSKMLRNSPETMVAEDFKCGDCNSDLLRLN